MVFRILVAAGLVCFSSPALGQVHIGGPDSLIQETMAPDGGGNCHVFADGADGTQAYFSQDLDLDGAVDAGETYIFRNGSRWKFFVAAGTGIASCCFTDEHAANSGVTEPDSLPEHGLIDTSTTTSEGVGHCFALGTASGYDVSTVKVIQRHLWQANQSISGFYPGVCTSTVPALRFSAGSASSAYSGGGQGIIKKACAGPGDCFDSDYVNGITFRASGVTPWCEAPSNSIYDNLLRRLRDDIGVLLACNFTDNVDLLACELQ